MSLRATLNQSRMAAVYLDIPSYLGSARLDERGEVISQTGMPISGVECATRTWMPATSPKARARNSGDAQNMGFFYRRDRHVVG